ncbi:MAG: hypothetical protein R2865_10520, partial [Deinococcales bacterium]
EQKDWHRAYLLSLTSHLAQNASKVFSDQFGLGKDFFKDQQFLHEALEAKDLPQKMLVALSKPPYTFDKVLSLILSLARQDFADKIRCFKPAGQRLSGDDLLALGLKPGPAMGQVLKQVAQARANSQLSCFEDELALAKSLLAGALPS